MNRFSLLRPVVVLLVAVGILTLPTRASAEERQHFVRGTVQFVSPTDIVGAGNATHLGRYTEVGMATISQTGELTGWVILTAANGDQLFETVSAQLNPFTGTITGTITIWGGTGRFEYASGSATLLAQIQPDGTIAAAVEGTIDY